MCDEKCEACDGYGWAVFQNWGPGNLEVQKCDMCDVFPDDIVAEEWARGMQDMIYLCRYDDDGDGAHYWWIGDGQPVATEPEGFTPERLCPHHEEERRALRNRLRRAHRRALGGVE